MAIIKCKNCGGDMGISEDKTIGVCEYCGSSMTLPKVDSDQRAAAFNRGNHFRRIGEFDKALAVYERIVAEDDTDAEAHWCCALCRFGIEYVEDPATYEWLPTCHRANFDSFLEDVDYLAAVEYSDGITRRQYQKDAVKIAEVQRGILATSQKEEPFDVFICYKESDENGQRTVDSTLAQDIYYQLTDKGWRVFFARITLEDKGGAEYEPYIFAALNSARVMVVVGTTAENLNAVWVKNEWSRFLSLMKKDHSKLLLPCYRDMDPYDLPEQLSVLQSYDVSKIGFVQDLIRGIDKVLDADKVLETKKETVVIQGEGGGNITALLKRGNTALEDGDWGKADEFFDRALDMNAECAEAYLGKAMSEAKVSDLSQLKDKFLPMVDQIKPNQILVSIAEHREKYIEENVVAGYLEKEDLQKICAFDFYYDSTLESYSQQMEHNLQLLAENKNLSRVEKYADSKLKIEITSFKNAIKNEMEQALYLLRSEDERFEKDIRGRYELLFPQWEQKITQMRLKAEADRDEDYQNAISFFEKQEYVQAADILSRLKNYKDALERTYTCAKSLQEAGDIENAAIIYGKVRGYKDATQRSFELWRSIVRPVPLASDASCAAGLRSDGTVVAVRNNLDSCQSDVLRWKDIVAVSADNTHTIGLKSDGTIIIAGYDASVVSGWENIVAISADSYHIVGLKLDGTVVIACCNVKKCKATKQCDVSSWKNIVAVSAGWRHVVGLKSDGTVVAVGDNGYGQCDVSEWKNMVAISAGWFHTVGLKSDGTVVAVGNNEYDQCDVSGWNGVIAISAGDFCTVVLKSNGTVEAIGDLFKDDLSLPYSDYGSYCKNEMAKWNDIVAISACKKYILGLKSDGTVLKVGNMDRKIESDPWDGVCRWTNIETKRSENYNSHISQLVKQEARKQARLEEQKQARLEEQKQEAARFSWKKLFGRKP